jgi:hypothetical protein
MKIRPFVLYSDKHYAAQSSILFTASKAQSQVEITGENARQG